MFYDTLSSLDSKKSAGISHPYKIYYVGIGTQKGLDYSTSR